MKTTTTNLPSVKNKPYRAFRSFATLMLVCGLGAAMIFVSLRDEPTIHVVLNPESDASEIESHVAVARSRLDKLAAAQEMESRVAVARGRLEKLSAAYSDAHRRDVAATRSEITRIISEAKISAPGRASAAAEPFQGFGNITNCVAMGAKDKVVGSDELVQYTTKSLEHANGLVIATHLDLLVALEALQQQSLARANDYHRETLALAETAGIDPVKLGIDPRAGSSIATGPNYAVHTATSAAISLTLEAALIKLTWNSIMKVLEPLIRKAGKTITAAGTAAVVDGPIPVGDIVGAVIAIGGGVWTAWDIKNAIDANNALPSTIDSALQEQLNELDVSAGESLDSLHRAFASLYRADT